MKWATTTALLASLLLPGPAGAQEAEEPAVTEPEQSSVEVVPAKGKAGSSKGSEQVYETYTVKSGDTLWDLSSKFLGNPWYWPKVWSYNPEIENPHWIYPGNQVRFYPGGDEMPAQVEGAQAPDELGDVTSGSMNSTEQFGEDDDVVAISQGTKFGYTAPKRSLMRQDGLVTQRELDDSGVIEKSWAEREMLDNFEKVYIKFRNKSAVRLGERYSIFRTMGTVKHPVSGESYGYLTRIMGTLRIVAIDQQYVTGLIDGTFDPIHRGDFVGPLGNFDKQIISKDNLREVKGVILVALTAGLPFMGEQHWVFIDKGSRDGVEEGNSFTVVRRGDPLLEELGEKKFPLENIGSLLVVDVKESASAALIIRSVRELEVGDQVQMRPMNSRASLP
ncbi:MAG: LysM peptidoglycan-binding domain-containing protein [Deltaproteobacteria bacterium]|nr:LysM peptidoglycan-binding domain-containing protein [Deltaproteobacteria bacterium]